MPSPRRAGRSRNKYGAIKTTVDGITFDSKAEAKRYSELKMLEKVGSICHIQRQTSFELLVNDTRIGTYRPDFGYCSNSTVIYEDVKGFDTPLSRWKRKHMKAQYGIDVQIVRTR